MGQGAALRPLGYLVKPAWGDDVYAAVELALACRVEPEADPVRILAELADKRVVGVTPAAFRRL